jgi:tripeptidyl-peptidase-1
MAWKMLILSLFAIAAITDAVPAPAPHVVHEKRETLHSRWVKKDRVASHALLPMRIGLTQTGLENAHVHLMDV